MNHAEWYPCPPNCQCHLLLPPMGTPMPNYAPQQNIVPAMPPPGAIQHFHHVHHTFENPGSQPTNATNPSPISFLPQMVPGAIEEQRRRFEERARAEQARRQAQRGEQNQRRGVKREIREPLERMAADEFPRHRPRTESVLEELLQLIEDLEREEQEQRELRQFMEHLGNAVLDHGRQNGAAPPNPDNGFQRNEERGQNNDDE